MYDEPSSVRLLIHPPMNDAGGVLYDNDPVWVNVQGSQQREFGMETGSGKLQKAFAKQHRSMMPRDV